MSDLTLPNGPVYTVEPDDTGAGVYAVQRALNRCGLFRKGIPADGVYGAKTVNRVTKFQQVRELKYMDGRFGPTSSKEMSHLLQELALAGKSLPNKITYAMVDLESGNHIAANNWSVSGGVDLSYAQRRVYGPPFDDAAVMRACDGLYQFKLLANTLRSRHDYYWGSENEVDTHEWAWRLSCLYHNYQSGANIIAVSGLQGLSPYWRTPQTWVKAHSTESGLPESQWRKFDDGVPVVTPLEWAQHYALGSEAHAHEGLAVRGVTGWNTP